MEKSAFQGRYLYGFLSLFCWYITPLYAWGFLIYIRNAGKERISSSAKFFQYSSKLSVLSLQLEIPKELISSEQLEELLLQRRPSFVPVDQEKKMTKDYDKDTGIVQRRLSNGIPVNYKVPYHLIPG